MCEKPVKQEPTPECLRFVGLLGHQFVVVGKSRNVEPVDDWVVSAECVLLDQAREYAGPNDRIFERINRQWKEVKFTVSGRRKL